MNHATYHRGQVVSLLRQLGLHPAAHRPGLFPGGVLRRDRRRRRAALAGLALRLACPGPQKESTRHCACSIRAGFPRSPGPPGSPCRRPGLRGWRRPRDLRPGRTGLHRPRAARRGLHARGAAGARRAAGLELPLHRGRSGRTGGCASASGCSTARRRAARSGCRSGSAARRRHAERGLRSQVVAEVPGRWCDEEVDLSAWGGKEVTLELAALVRAPAAGPLRGLVVAAPRRSRPRRASKALSGALARGARPSEHRLDQPRHAARRPSRRLRLRAADLAQPRRLRRPRAALRVGDQPGAVDPPVAPLDAHRRLSGVARRARLADDRRGALSRRLPDLRRHRRGAGRFDPRLRSRLRDLPRLGLDPRAAEDGRLDARPLGALGPPVLRSSCTATRSTSPTPTPASPRACPADGSPGEFSKEIWNRLRKRFSDEEKRYAEALYDGDIAYTDGKLGEFFAEFEKRRPARRTRSSS